MNYLLRSLGDGDTRGCGTQGVATAFWPTGATSPSGNPVYGGPASKYPASMRFELLPEACKLCTLLRFKVPADLCPNPDEAWFLECKARVE